MRLVIVVAVVIAVGCGGRDGGGDGGATGAEPMCEDLGGAFAPTCGGAGGGGAWCDPPEFEPRPLTVVVVGGDPAFCDSSGMLSCAGAVCLEAPEPLAVDVDGDGSLTPEGDGTPCPTCTVSCVGMARSCDSGAEALGPDEAWILCARDGDFAEGVRLTCESGSPTCVDADGVPSDAVPFCWLPTL